MANSGSQSLMASVAILNDWLLLSIHWLLWFMVQPLPVFTGITHPFLLFWFIWQLNHYSFTENGELYLWIMAHHCDHGLVDPLRRLVGRNGQQPGIGGHIGLEGHQPGSDVRWSSWHKNLPSSLSIIAISELNYHEAAQSPSLSIINLD